MTSGYAQPLEWYSDDGLSSTSSSLTISPDWTLLSGLPSLNPPPPFHNNNDAVIPPPLWTTEYSALPAQQAYQYSTTTSAEAFPLPSLPSLVGAVSQALQNPQATVGDVLQSLPSSSSVHSPPTTTQHRLLSLDDEVTETSSNSLKVSPFIDRLAHMLDNPAEFQDCIVWDAAGTGFVVRHTSDHLIQGVLPKFFGHSNIPSFTRQLNVYGFTRMSQDDLSARLDTPVSNEYSGWSHAHFLRDDRSTIHLLTPKPSRARMQKKAEKQARLEREEQQRRKAHLTSRAARMDASGDGGSVGSGSGSAGLVLWANMPPAPPPPPMMGSER